MESIILRNFKPIGFNPMPDFDKGDLFIDGNGTIKSFEEAGKIKNIGNVKEININDSFLSPGWIDLHTHIYYGVGDISILPKEIGPKTGTVLLVDAGSSGESNFEGFKEHIINKNKFPIKSFINISSLGMPDGTASFMSELTGWESINLLKLSELCHKNRNLIKGIKLRASKHILQNLGIEAVHFAVNTARLCELPLFVHMGEPPAFLYDLIEILQPGDIITHCFNGKVGNNVFQNIDLIKVYRHGMEKGIKFDIGHGSSSFSFSSARMLIDAGILPFSISTDAHKLNLNGPVYDLPTTMSKMMAIGMSLSQIIDCVSENPAKYLGLKDWTKIRLGEKAFLTGFRIQNGKFLLNDSNSNTDGPVVKENYEQLNVEKIIEPIIAFYGNSYCMCSNRFLRLKDKNSE